MLLQRILLVLSSFALLVFITVFLKHNQPGLTNFTVISLVGAIYAVGFVFLAKQAFSLNALVSTQTTLSRIVLITLACAMIYLVLDNVHFDYYQAISTSEAVIYSWIVSWAALAILLLLHTLNPKLNTSILYLALYALAGVPTINLTAVISDPQVTHLANRHQDVFVGGEDGYKIYRIPAILVIPQNQQLANGEQLTSDRIIVMAEARRDAALDTGVIDLVQKISDDGGKTWSKQQVICQHIEQDMQGKCGNATPVLDSQTGTIFLAYNLSGIPENNPEGSRPHTSHIMKSLDGGLNYERGIQLPMPNAVFGPGHGIQKQRQPNKGRLIIPFNTSVGGQGSSVALYSDDHGNTWQAGAPLGTGNENEIAEMADGSLLMATRHIAPVGSPPEPNGRLFSVSNNGGEHWLNTHLQQQIITPICQASLIALNGSHNLLFANPADTSSRVKLTLRASNNLAQTWDNELLVYQGPSGYSQLAELSNSSILVLYESGVLSYSEKISLTTIPLDKILK